MQSKSILLVALFVGTTLAGCLSAGDDVEPQNLNGILDPELRAPLTEPIYEILGHFDHTFTGTEGIQLYVDYWRPDLPEGEASPVILMMTPYQSAQPAENPAGETLGYEHTAYYQWMVDYWVPRGYTMAFADVRGNHKAGGCIDQTAAGQWQDGYDYVEWLGTQEWSNGNVGMWGVSYDGETQFTTAMMNPPHLKTIVPIASVSNQYEWSFYNGVPYELQPFIGMFSYATGSIMPSYDPEDALVYHEKFTCQPEQFAAGTDFSGDNTTFWKDRDYRHMAGQIEASVLHVHGLNDWNVRPNHVDPLFNAITSEKRAIFGQWHHATPDRDDWMNITNAWFDHYLLGLDNGILDQLPPVLIEDSQENWWGIDAFPPTQQDWLELELSADGMLVAPGNATVGDLEIVDYPEEVLVQFGPDMETYATMAPMMDAPDTLVWEFETTEDLRLVGRPVMDLTLTTDATSTHWAARLTVVEDTECKYTHERPDDHDLDREYTQRICYNAGFQDTRHRDGQDDPKDLTPGEAYDLTIEMYPQYDVIAAGSTIRLTLSNNDDETTQDLTFARSLVHLGDGQAMLRLPLAPAHHVEIGSDELPVIYGPYLEA